MDGPKFRWVWRIGCGLAFSGAVAGTAVAQPGDAASSPAPSVAFVGVHLVSMANDEVAANQTVLVTGDRIVAIGLANRIAIPDDALVIDGAGRYLVPGLTDAHVHLTMDMPWAPTRAGFGDAPLYLAHGVTTVINLRGSPNELEWRRRINAGELVGPTIYTAGEFINEPRVTTPDEVAADVAAQRGAGYDLLKFHEAWTPDRGFTTTTGLSAAAYRRMNEAARENGLPLVGHAPISLGLDAMLEARQPLAHLGMLTNVYFLPIAANLRWVAATAVSAATLAVLGPAMLIAAFVRRARKQRQSVSTGDRRLRALLRWQSFAAVLATACAALFLPGGPWFDSVALRVAFVLVLLAMTAIAVALAVMTAASWREPQASRTLRLQGVIGATASLVLVVASFAFWLPATWRTTDRAIEDLAKRLRAAGISVQTTLVVYETLGGASRDRLAQDPAIAYLSSETRARWRAAAAAPAPSNWYPGFTRKVARALNRAGVTLVAGTDAMGMPLVAPGSSMHRELRLLIASGLTPYEAMRAATVAPAAFLGKQEEFGTIAAGKRADLVLVDGNPLDDVSRLTRPAGVMARGRWFSRSDLQHMLMALEDPQ